jgi:dihydroneopterin aldolase
LPEDKIILEGLLFYGYHGVLPEERSLGQPFRVSVHIYLPLKAAGQEDNLEKTINYAQVYREIAAIMEGTPVQLLETLAERIAGAVLAYEAALAVQVTVEKTKPPLPGIMDGVKICIHREKA